MSISIWDTSELIVNNLYYWLNSSPLSNGFFRTSLNRQWQPTGTQVASVVSQSRLIFTMSMGYRLTGDESFRAAVVRGADFLLNYFPNNAQGDGKWYWSVLPDGTVSTVSDPNGRADLNRYGEAFAIFGLANAYQVNPDSRYLDAALSTLRNLDLWTDIETYPETVHDHEKTFNSVLHTFEALLYLSDVALPNSSLWKEIQIKADSLATFIFSELYNSTGHIPEKFNAQWQPLSTSAGGYIEVGHIVEMAFFISAAIERGLIPGNYLSQGQKLLDFGIEHGYDAQNGGIITRVSETGQPIRTDKIWWEQNELLRTIAQYASLHGREDLWSLFRQTSHYVETNFIDEVYGGWYAQPADVLGDNEAAKAKGNIWKVGYHVTTMHAQAIQLYERGELGLGASVHINFPNAVSVGDDSSASYEISLAVQPTEPVIITVTDEEDSTGTPTTLIFTASNWNQPQTVAIDTDNVLPEDSLLNINLQVSQTSSDPNYNQLSPLDLVTQISIGSTSPPASDTLHFSLNSAQTFSDLNLNPIDIVEFDGTGFRLFFDGSDVGLTTGKIDAIDVISDTEILLSFNNAIRVPGLGTVDDSDIVRFTANSLGENTLGTFSLEFDASDVGLRSGSEDVDAITLLPDGSLLISTTGSLNPGSGTIAADEDIVLFTPTSLGETTAGSFSLYVDSSDIGLGSEDVDAFGINATGDLYFSTTNSFIVSGLSGDDEDVFGFTPSSLGNSTSGSFASALFFDGDRFGLAVNDITGLDISGNGASGAPGDTTPPSISSLTPTDNATNVPVGSNLQIQFSEVVQAGTGTIVLKRLSDGSEIESINVTSNQVTISGSTVTIDPSDLAADTDIYVEIAAGAFEDGAGNDFAGIADDTTWNFTTAAPPVGLDNLVFVSSQGNGSVGGVSYRDEDVLTYDPSTGSWEQFFDGSDVGITADTNAVHVMDDGSVLLSFESAVTVSGLGTVDDSDIIRFTPTSTGANTAGSFELYFDGSDVGLTSGGEDIDSVAFTPNGDLVIGVTGTFNAGGVSAQDEDLIVFEATSLGANTSGNLSLYFDGSDVGLDSSSEDVDGFWVAPDSELVLSTRGNFSVPNGSGDGDDLTQFMPISLGTNTAGTFGGTIFDGDDAGFSTVDAFSLYSAGLQTLP
ncbi:MAG: AGE family epimerase/isomerase [Synechococcus sp.]